ncbi:MAG: hypothetical protein ACMUJM_17995 [bacterium]
MLIYDGRGRGSRYGLGFDRFRLRIVADSGFNVRSCCWLRIG